MTPQKAQARVRACCLLPAVRKSQLVCHCQVTEWLFCSDADNLLQSKHIKPIKPFQQGCGKEKTCTREQASHDRCLQKVQGTRPLEDARALLWPGGPHVQAPHKCHQSAFQSYRLRFMFSPVGHIPRNFSQATQIPQRY